MNIHTITRQIVLDTETTGMNKFGLHYEGHKIIEIGAVEIVKRCLTGKKFHVYLNPNRVIDIEAFRVHGISDQFLKDKPIFSEIVSEFLEFISGSELIIHNASFDLGFLNYELKNFDIHSKKIESYCTVIDSLKLARKMFPGQRNSLDALCERFLINNDKRVLHNALFDAQLLANVFLSMTRSQMKIKFVESNKENIFLNTTDDHHSKIKFNCCVNQKHILKKNSLKIIMANDKEKKDHEKCLDLIKKD